MPTTTFSIASLISNCDDAFPSAGTWGYMTLLGGNLATGLAYTADSSTTQLTTATAHGLVTGSRIRLVGGTLPTPLLANTDYFAIVSTSNVFKLALTLADAESSTSIDLTDGGSGALTFAEQALVSTDSLAVLINKEVIHPSWATRALIDNLGAAANVAGIAEKPTKTLGVSNTSATVLSYQHYLFIESTAGSTANIGNIPVGAGFILSSEAGIQSISVGDPPLAVFFKLRARNA
jgi:hypothetical protein